MSQLKSATANLISHNLLADAEHIGKNHWSIPYSVHQYLTKNGFDNVYETLKKLLHCSNLIIDYSLEWEEEQVILEMAKFSYLAGEDITENPFNYKTEKELFETFENGFLVAESKAMAS